MPEDTCIITTGHECDGYCPGQIIFVTNLCRRLQVLTTWAVDSRNSAAVYPRLNYLYTARSQNKAIEQIVYKTFCWATANLFHTIYMLWMWGILLFSFWSFLLPFRCRLLCGGPVPFPPPAFAKISSAHWTCSWRSRLLPASPHHQTRCSTAKTYHLCFPPDVQLWIPMAMMPLRTTHSSTTEVQSSWPPGAERTKFIM